MRRILLAVGVVVCSMSAWAGAPLDRSTGWTCTTNDSLTPPAGQASPMDCRSSWYRWVTTQYPQCKNPPASYTEDTGVLDYGYVQGTNPPTTVGLDDIPYCSGYSTQGGWPNGAGSLSLPSSSGTATCCTPSGSNPVCPPGSYWGTVSCKCGHGKWDGYQCSTKSSGTGTYTPSTTFASGSGATTSTNFASWQQVMPYVTLDGTTTFSSLGTTSGGITFGLPSAVSVPTYSSPVGSGTADVDGTSWNAEVTATGITLFNSSGQALTVANLTSTSSVNYHVQYSFSLGKQSWTPTAFFGATQASVTPVNCNYQVSGSRVDITNCSVIITNKNGGTGRLTVSLPILEGGSGPVCGDGITSGVVSFVSNPYQGYVDFLNSDGHWIDDTDLNVNSYVEFSACYNR